MTLQAIIIRADGAFAETEELRRRSFIAAFGEAGFDWTINREAFAASCRFGGLKTRMAHFVRQYLKRGGEAPDIDQLIAAMHRRACKVFQTLIANGALDPRSGMRELVVMARQEGVRLALAGAMKIEEAQPMLVHALGSRGVEMFNCITLVGEAEVAADPQALYRATLQQLEIDPARCLVIEATLGGAAAAKAVGFPVITTRSAYSNDCSTAGDSAGMFEDLPSIIVRSGGRRLGALSADDRTELFSTLQHLHRGIYDPDTTSKGIAVMRVSDILKVKGSAVKTIEPTATIRAFAQGLRVEAVGAMVVKDTKGGVLGIISERDLARGVSEFGNDLPSMPVSALMTKTVITCAPEDAVAAVAKVMTHRRIRHLPVVVDGKLSGLVSIGDVLKHRLDEVQLEANVLRDFALARK
jgi:CBS domain-containing protein/beta-phosphoglucomutase-like phosphatase (HAD superfamily)